MAPFRIFRIFSVRHQLRWPQLGCVRACVFRSTTGKAHCKPRLIPTRGHWASSDLEWLPLLCVDTGYKWSVSHRLSVHREHSSGCDPCTLFLIEKEEKAAGPTLGYEKRSLGGQICNHCHDCCSFLESERHTAISLLCYYTWSLAHQIAPSPKDSKLRYLVRRRRNCLLKQEQHGNSRACNDDLQETWTLHHFVSFAHN